MKINKYAKLLFYILGGLSFLGCNDKETPSPSKNVNVKSATYTATTWSWTSPYYYVELEVPELTSSNIDSSGVMVYCGTKNGTWVALPFTQYNNISSNYFMSFSTSVNKVQVTWVYNTSLSDGVNPNEYYGTIVKFKVVVIPPGARMDLDLTDYEAVKNEFGLKD